MHIYFTQSITNKFYSIISQSPTKVYIYIYTHTNLSSTSHKYTINNKSYISNNIDHRSITTYALTLIIMRIFVNSHINSLIPDIRRRVIRYFHKRLLFTLLEENHPHKKHHKCHQCNTPSSKNNPS